MEDPSTLGIMLIVVGLVEALAVNTFLKRLPKRLRMLILGFSFLLIAIGVYLL